MADQQPLVQLYQILISLSPDAKPLWGKMSAQHMVEHLSFTVRISNGSLPAHVFTPADKIPALKRIMLSKHPFPKNFISPAVGEDVLPLEFNSLEEALQDLETQISAYYEFYENNPEAQLANPVFGELNKAEWDYFHKKHFDHHLAQFGLLSVNI